MLPSNLSDQPNLNSESFFHPSFVYPFVSAPLPPSSWTGFDNQNVISTENSFTVGAELPVSLTNFVGDFPNDVPGFSSTLASGSTSTLVQRHTPRRNRTGAPRVGHPAADTPGTFVEVDLVTFKEGIKYDAETFKAHFPHAWAALGDVRVDFRNFINTVGTSERKDLRKAASILIAEKMTLLIALQQPIEKGELPYFT